MSETLFSQHRDKLQAACEAIRTRAYWSGYPEVPSGKIYGETARKDGAAAFQGYCGSTFELDQPGAGGTVGSETSPFGLDLNIRYPQSDLASLVAAASDAQCGWRDVDLESRVGVCLEILERLNRRSFEMACAVMHTTGQGFMMAFQAGGPHAQDRGLEAVAYAYEELSRLPREAEWTKRVSKTDSITLRKTYRVVPRGIAAVVGCSTFPTWNSYPALFASLATGNAVIVKPHPGAILPLALTVRIARDVLREAGHDPNVVTLLADSPDAPRTRDLVTHPAVGIVDYTGGSAFGDWVEENARQAVVFTEKAGVNATILDSADDLKALTGNLAFSLCLYSGQMCTTPQNIFIPAGGITVGGEKLSFDDTANALIKAIDWLLSDPARGAEILGAIQNPATAARIEQAAQAGGTVLRASTPVVNEQFPDARVHSPLVLQVDASQTELFQKEMFGPICYLVKTADTAESIRLAAETARSCGALTSGVYTTDEATRAAAEQALINAGANISCNLVGPIYVNQAAAFSDYHVSGANPAGNATLTDAAFVTSRFRVVQSRSLVPAQG